jgi:hypothetical protein
VLEAVSRGLRAAPDTLAHEVSAKTEVGEMLPKAVDFRE